MTGMLGIRINQKKSLLFRKKRLLFFFLVFVICRWGYAESFLEKPKELTESTLIVKTALRGSDVMHVAMFPDGEKIVVALKDGTARIFSMEGKLLETLVGHDEMVTSVSVSPNGDFVATSSVDQDVGIWDIQKAKPIRVFSQHKAPINSVVFSPDGKWIASASIDGDIQVWDIQTKKLVQRLKQPSSGLISAEFSSDGRSLLTLQLTVTNRKTIAIGAARIFDVKTGKLQSTFSGKPGTYVLGFAPSGNRVLLADVNKTAQIVDPSSKRTLATLVGHQGLITSATFSPDGRLVVTEGLDQSAHVWDVETGKILYLLKGQVGGSHAAPLFSPDGSKLITVNSRGEIRLWVLVDTENTVSI